MSFARPYLVRGPLVKNGDRERGGADGGDGGGGGPLVVTLVVAGDVRFHPDAADNLRIFPQICSARIQTMPNSLSMVASKIPRRVISLKTP